jgi:hypothetical protein
MNTFNRIVLINSLQRQTAVAIEGGQQIIEVVRDAAGKLTDGRV